VLELEEGVLDTLVIVSNKGLHAVPQEYAVGEIYFASEGEIDCNDVSGANEFIDSAIIRLKDKLLERRWKRVILIPFGHVVLNMAIKMAVFRTLWIETEDVFYFGYNRYGMLQRDTKKILASNQLG